MPRAMLAVATIILLAAGALWAADPAAAPPAPTPTSSAPTATAPATVSPEVALGQRRIAIARELQDISLRYLGSLDPAKREEGRQRALLIRDPVAVDPVLRILGPGDEAMRTLECEMLGQIPGAEASAALAKIVLVDLSDAVRQAAIQSIKLHSDKGAFQPLVNALRGTGDAYTRAANALGDVGNLDVALALVQFLRKPTEQTIQVWVTPKPSGMFSGTMQPYITGYHTIVSGSMAVTVPDFAYSNNGVGVGNPSPQQPVLENRTIVVQAEQPIIRDAIKKITGQDYGFDVVKWRTWLGKAMAAEKAGLPPPPAEPAAPVPPPPAK